jgi:hypothetical protein
MVADLRSVSNYTAHWDINFTTLVDDWEVDFVSSFFNVLYPARVGWEGDGRLNALKMKILLTPLSLGRAFGGLRLL